MQTALLVAANLKRNWDASLPFTNSNDRDESAAFVILSRSMLTGTPMPLVDTGRSNSKVEIFCAEQTLKMLQTWKTTKQVWSYFQNVFAFNKLYAFKNYFIVKVTCCAFALPKTSLRFPGRDPAIEILNLPGCNNDSPFSLISISISGVIVNFTCSAAPALSDKRLIPVKNIKELGLVVPCA